MQSGGQRSSGADGLAPDLLASFFTLAGNVHPFRPPAISTVPLRRRIEAAGRAGFTGFGFAKDDLAYHLGSLSFRDITGMMADNGIDFCEVELLRNWFSLGSEGEASAKDQGFLLNAAGALNARHIKIGSTGPELHGDQIIAAFAALCDQAAAVGTAIAMELSPMGPIAGLAGAAAMISLAARANGGLLLDIWHVVRGGYDLLEIGRLPPGTVRFAELCDGSTNPAADYVADTVRHRLPCGAGTFPIGGFVAALAECGYSGPYGVEILSDAQRALDPERAAQVAFDGAGGIMRQPP